MADHPTESDGCVDDFSRLVRAGESSFHKVPADFSVDCQYLQFTTTGAARYWL